jgi:hypothetical protein
MTEPDFKSLADDVCEDGGYDAACVIATTPEKANIGMSREDHAEGASVYLLALLLDHVTRAAPEATHGEVAGEAITLLAERGMADHE